MSRLDELIAELCPDGVCFVKLGDLCDLVTKQTGFDYTNHIKSRLLNEKIEGSVPYIQTKFFSGKKFDYNTDYYVPSDIVEKFPKITLDRKCLLFSIVGASIGNVGLFPGHTKCFLGGAICVAKIKAEYNADYLYYCVESAHVQRQIRNKTKGAGQATVTVEDIRSFTVPFPPLPVQQEIVRILDHFTELTAAFTAALTAELTARKKQYEYYSNALFLDKAETKWVALSDIADIGTGSSNTNEAEENGRYPFYVRSQDTLRKNKYEYDETAIITAGDGVGVGKVFHFVEGKYALHQRAYRIHINTNSILPKYFFYYFRTAFYDYIQRNMFQGSVSSIRRPMLNAFPVPIVTLIEQRKIISILDRFDSLCNDLTSGLPAEIAARQKQYEYYRDKLLTFKELPKS